MSMTETTEEDLNLWIPITDEKGNLLIDPLDCTEPEPGSILLTEGSHGTAWQRHFAGKRLWHSAGTGSARTWEELIKKRNVVLVYDAAPREEGR